VACLFVHIFTKGGPAEKGKQRATRCTLRAITLGTGSNVPSGQSLSGRNAVGYDVGYDARERDEERSACSNDKLDKVDYPQ